MVFRITCSTRQPRAVSRPVLLPCFTIESRRQYDASMAHLVIPHLKTLLQQVTIG
jgi:hypothetical protein